MIRPLLIYPKEELYQFAQRQAFVYFEDETNQTNEYLRNRLRNQVLPLLKQENPQFLDQIASFSNEQRFAQEFIQEQIEPQLSGNRRTDQTRMAHSFEEIIKRNACVPALLFNRVFPKNISAIRGFVKPTPDDTNFKSFE